MVKLHIELIDRLDEASAALSAALDVMSEHYGLDDPLYDRLVEASAAAAAMSARLQDRADVYGEMTHAGLA